MGNTVSEPTKFSQQYDQAVQVKEQKRAEMEQIKTELQNAITNYFLIEIQSTIPEIILSKTQKGVREHIYHCKSTDEIKKLYSIYFNKPELTEMDNSSIIFAIYQAVHSDEFREQIKMFGKELGKNVKIILPRKFNEKTGNLFTGEGDNDEIRDHNFAVHLDHDLEKISRSEKYQYQAKYYNKYLNHFLFKF